MKESARQNNLDVIRIVAAMVVIFGHSFPLNGLGAPPGFLTNGVHALGVKIFFTLSGFLIAQSWASDPHLLRFFARRALRLFPALAVVLLLSALVLGPSVTTVPLRAYFADEQVWRYLGNISLNITYNLPGVFENNPYARAVNGSLWSLPAEVVMYFVVPPLMTLAKLSRWPRVVLWIAAIASTAANIWFLRTPGAPVTFGFYGIALTSMLDLAPYFIVGMLAYGCGWQNRISAQTALLTYFVFSLFAGHSPVVGELALTVLMPILVMGLGFATPPRFAAVSKYGDVSYGLYLYGFVVQQTVTHLLGPHSPEFSTLVVGGISYAFAFASWHLVEKRALRFRPSRPGAKAPQPATS